MKMKLETIKLWTCPKCKRQFERTGQSHSCRPFAIEKHLEGRPEGKLLFDQLKKEVKKQIGAFKTESLECCIHFVSTFTFAAVRIFKNKIQIEFSLNHKIKSSRIVKSQQLSANRHLYYIDIYSEDEINKELLEWIKEATNRKSKQAEAI
jgi:L-cysteine desulfidase